MKKTVASLVTGGVFVGSLAAAAATTAAPPAVATSLQILIKEVAKATMMAVEEWAEDS